MPLWNEQDRECHKDIHRQEVYLRLDEEGRVQDVVRDFPIIDHYSLLLNHEMCYSQLAKMKRSIPEMTLPWNL